MAKVTAKVTATTAAYVQIAANPALVQITRGTARLVAAAAQPAVGVATFFRQNQGAPVNYPLDAADKLWMRGDVEDNCEATILS